MLSRPGKNCRVRWQFSAGSEWLFHIQAEKKIVLRNNCWHYSTENTSDHFPIEMISSAQLQWKTVRWIIQGNWDTFLERCVCGITAETITNEFPFTYIVLGGGRNVREWYPRMWPNKPKLSAWVNARECLNWRYWENVDSYNLAGRSPALILVAQGHYSRVDFFLTFPDLGSTSCKTRGV